MNPNVSDECKICSTKTPFLGVEIGYRDLCGTCKRKKSYKEKNIISWNSGLTKDSDERMLKSSQNMKKHYDEHGHHMTGKTKDNNEMIANKSIKVSASVKKFYETNKHWSSGLSNETSDIIAKRSKSISRSLKGRIFSDQTLEIMRKKKLLTHEIISLRLKEKQLLLVNQYVDTMTKCQLNCMSCNVIFERSLSSVFNNNAKCPNCFPPWAIKTSVWQQEINDFVQTLQIRTELNNRKILEGLEADIYIPDLKFAIECNGLYWHSVNAGRFEKNHAENKRLIAIKNNIKLLTIFEDEWRDKREIIKSMITHRLNKSIKKNARDLTIIETKPALLKSFFHENHIDGHAKSSFGLTLTDKDKNIIGACTLRWAKNGNDKNTLEIARLCFKKNTHVNGGLSRLIKHAKNIAIRENAKQLMTYSDNRLGGDGYINASFGFVKLTPIRFWWTDNYVRFDRFKYKASKLRNMSEKEVADEAKVSRIYGCSNSKFVIDL